MGRSQRKMKFVDIFIGMLYCSGFEGCFLFSEFAELADYFVNQEIDLRSNVVGRLRSTPLFLISTTTNKD